MSLEHERKSLCTVVADSVAGKAETLERTVTRVQRARHRLGSRAANSIVRQIDFKELASSGQASPRTLRHEPPLKGLVVYILMWQRQHAVGRSSNRRGALSRNKPCSKRLPESMHVSMAAQGVR